MHLPHDCRLKVSHLSDASEARRLAKAMAMALGFDMTESEDFAIVVSELASNLVKHATNGQLVLAPIEDEERLGIKIVSQDDGPGIPDVEQAITDGYSTIGSLGYGLGAINRLMDEFNIQSRPGCNTGTLITCLRWKRELPQNPATCPISFGIATRAHLNSELNGDAFIVQERNESALIALIDGLGHGQFAHYAARTAREYLEKHYDQPPRVLFREVGQACSGSRGVVMALARFDWRMRPIRLSFASIGNIEARIFGSSAPMNLMAQRGVVGFNAPDPVIAEYDWNPANILVLHTDGLGVKWRWHDFPELARASAAYTAQHLLQKLARNDDDATVIVVRKS